MSNKTVNQLVDSFVSDLRSLIHQEAVAAVKSELGLSKAQPKVKRKPRAKAKKKVAKRSTANKLNIVSYADKHGVAAAMKRFAVTKGQVAAWKAHRTMGTYK